MAVYTHDREIGAVRLDLLRNDLSRIPTHHKTLDRWSCGRIGHDVFETLVQQRIGTIQVVRQSCPSTERRPAEGGIGCEDLEHGQRCMAYRREGATQGDR